MKSIRIRSNIGDQVQSIIHGAIDALPLPAKTKRRIKQCGGCNNRRLALNRAGKAVEDFLSPKPTNPSIPPPPSS